MELINENKYESESQDLSNTNTLNTVKITIPSIPETYTFSRKCYDIDILSNVMPKSEFDKIINKASFVFGDCLSQKRQNDKFEEAFSVKITRPLSLFFILLFVIFFCITQSSNKNYVTFAISILFLLGGIGLTIYEGIRSFCRKNRKYYTLQEIILKNMTEYFEKVNQKLAEEKKNLLFEFLPDDQNILCNVFQENNAINDNYKNNNENLNKISFNNSSSFSNKSKSSISEENNETNNLNLLKLKNNDSSSSHESKKEELVSESNKSQKKKTENNKVVPKDYGNEIINTDSPMIKNNNLEEEKKPKQTKKENTRKKNSKRDATKHNSLI